MSHMKKNLKEDQYLIYYDINKIIKMKRIKELNKKGIEVFGDAEKYKIWMSVPNVIFGGKKPSELLNTIEGIDKVNMELIRIEYGILS